MKHQHFLFKFKLFLAFIYELSKHAYFLLDARPSGSRWRVGLGPNNQKRALNNPYFGQLLYNLLIFTLFHMLADIYLFPNDNKALILSASSTNGNREIPSSPREIHICFKPLLATRSGTGNSRLYVNI